MPRVSSASNLHPGKGCGPCKLCKGNKSRYWHIGQAGPQHAQLSINLRSLGIEDCDCICQACQRKHQNPNPSSTEKRKVDEVCAVDGCKHVNVKKIKTNIDNFPPYILDMFEVQEHAETTSQLTICSIHYSSLYNFTKRVKCCICYGTKLLRHPGDLEMASKFATLFLQLEDLTLDSNSKVCNACFLGIQRYSKSPTCVHSLNSNKDFFLSLVSSYRNCSIDNCDSYESFAFADSLVYLGDELLSDRPVLLSDVYAKYKVTYSSQLSFVSQPFSSIDPEQSPPKSQRHFHTSINVAFGECLTFSQIPGQPRYGTMIRRTGSSVANMLHILLFTQHQDQGKLSVDDCSKGQDQSLKLTDRKRLFYQLTNVAEDLNKRIISSAKEIINKDRAEGIKLDTFTFREEALRIDPVVFNFLTAITQGPHEKGKKLFNSTFQWDQHYACNTHTSEVVSYSKFLRRFFLSNSLLFTTNEQCYTHLHMFIADVLDRYTRSSSACFATLSKFGVSVSKSTFLRHQTKVSVREMNSKVNVLNNSFCIASIDNIDRNFTYSSVSCSKSDRGFHGTSVQAVEPLPLSTSIPVAMQVDGSTTEPANEANFSAPQNVPASVLEQFHQASNILQDRDTSRPSTSRNPYISLSLSDFELDGNDKKGVTKLGEKVFLYMLVKSVTQDEFPELVLPDLKSSFAGVIPPPEQSRAHFTSVLHAPADSQHTLLDVLDLLHSKHQVGDKIDYLVVAGDGKTYQLLLRLKKMYGEELGWMLPFIGDWHLLKNSQAPLLKVYLDAGLHDLLSVFHKGSTLKAVSKASGFQKTHQFLLQVWEALYRYFLISFKESMDMDGDFHKVLQELRAFLSVTKQNLFPAIWTSELSDVIYRFHTVFSTYFSALGESNATVRFWYNFVSRDMLHYFSLFYSIRSRDFSLRNASVRLLAPVFHALDRPMYLRIVPEHLASLKLFPPDILSVLQAGAFAVSISGQSMSCVALDEAHEMLINKDVKMAMTTAEPEGLSRLVHYLSYRTKVHKNVIKQQPHPSSKTPVQTSIFKSTETNIRTYLTKLSECKLFLQSESPLLRHLFSDKKASDTVSSDLLSFYDEGEQSLLAYIKCFLLRTSSEAPKRRRRNLATFTLKVKGQRKQQQELKDHKLQIACLRRQIAFSKCNNVAVSDLSQFVPLPRAICLPDGVPYKGNKASSSSLLQKCYPAAFTSNLLESTSRCFIIDSMFLINNTRPLDCHKTFRDYAQFLYRRWVADTVSFLKAAEIHLVFDHPGRHGTTPKDIERSRRDKGKDSNETAAEVDSNTPTPSNWAKFLQNRGQKRMLVKYLCREILSLAATGSVCPARLVVAGGFEGEDVDKAFQIVHGICEEAPDFNSNHEEADSRVWFHAFKTSCASIIIYSPDRDILHIGLPFISTALSIKSITVQLSWKVHDNLYVDMNKLVSCFHSDLSFQWLADQLPNIGKLMQVIFICSGCDYVSYFKGQTKRVFLKAFQQFCKFITGGMYEGYLHEVYPTNWESGLLSFYRLIGSVYFVTHAGGFTQDTPSEVFASVFTEGMTQLDHHIAFVGAIRDGHFHRINDEALWMPSAEALRLHWQRCCWTALLWEQSLLHTVSVPVILDYGWEIDDMGKLSVIWDTKENASHITDNIKFLKEGCKCRTGCQNRRCKCVRRESLCGPGCSCVQCQNRSDRDQTLGVLTASVEREDDELQSLSDEESEGDSDKNLSDFKEQGESDIEYDSDADIYDDIDAVVTKEVHSSSH